MDTVKAGAATRLGRPQPHMRVAVPGGMEGAEHVRQARTGSLKGCCRQHVRVGRGLQLGLTAYNRHAVRTKLKSPIRIVRRAWRWAQYGWRCCAIMSR